MREVDTAERGGPQQPGSPLDFLRVLWERKAIVLMAVIVSVGAAEAISLSSEKQYSASSQLVFRDPGLDRTLFGSELFETGGDPERETSTNIEIIESPGVTARVRSALRLPPDAEPDRDIDVSAGDNTDVVEIEAVTGDPRFSARLANAYAQEYISYQRELNREKVRDARRLLERNLATATGSQARSLRRNLEQLEVLESLQTGNADVIARARPDSDAVSPKPLQNGLLAAILGLLLGAALALVADFVDRRLKRTDDFERAFGHSAIVSIPIGAVADRRTGKLDEMRAEPYRMLRESLRFLEVTGEHRCILITSPDAGEGKTTVTVNLARALVAGGQRVIIVEADLRRPNAAAQLATRSNSGPGLSGALVGSAPLRDLLVESEESADLLVLPAGPIPPNPADLLRTRRVDTLLDEARELVDVVLIDAPPLLPVSDTQVLLDLERIDGVLVLGRAYHTRRDRARSASRILARTGRRVLGVVVTFARDRSELYYYYYATETGDNGRGDEGALPARPRSEELS